jgi:hypothetical protein
MRSQPVLYLERYRAIFVSFIPRERSSRLRYTDLRQTQNNVHLNR